MATAQEYGQAAVYGRIARVTPELLDVFRCSRPSDAGFPRTRRNPIAAVRR